MTAAVVSSTLKRAFRPRRASTTTTLPLLQSSTNAPTTSTSSSSMTISPNNHQNHQIDSNALRIPRPLSKTLYKPIPNSYWATPTLLACEYPYSPFSPRPKLDLLLSAGIRTFIDLTQSGELIHYEQHLRVRAHSLGFPLHEIEEIEYHRFPIPDRAVPESMEFIGSIMDLLRECERRGRIVAVHCRGGIGRTGTVVGCWLVESGLAKDGEDALSILAEEWKTVEKCRRFPTCPQTPPQFEFVRNFKRLSSSEVGGSVSVVSSPASASVSSIKTAGVGVGVEMKSVRKGYIEKSTSW